MLSAKEVIFYTSNNLLLAANKNFKTVALHPTKYNRLMILCSNTSFKVKLVCRAHKEANNVAFLQNTKKTKEGKISLSMQSSITDLTSQDTFSISKSIACEIVQINDVACANAALHVIAPVAAVAVLAYPNIYVTQELVVFYMHSFIETEPNRQLLEAVLKTFWHQSLAVKNIGTVQAFACWVVNSSMWLMKKE